MTDSAGKARLALTNGRIWLGMLMVGTAVWAGCGSSGDDLNVMIPKMIDKWKGPSNVDAAGDLFNATNPDARRIAVAHISQKEWGHEPPYMKAYHVLATSDPDPMVRAQALRALGTSGQPNVAEDLISGLGHADPQVRRDAAAAMCDITNPVLVDPLLEHLKNDVDAQTRINCAQALGKYFDRRVIMALADALDDRDVAVELKALGSLKAITGKDLGQERGPWAAYAAALPEPKPTVLVPMPTTTMTTMPAGK